MGSCKYKSIHLLCMCIILVSCSPAFNSIVIDIRQPAVNPIDFENKSIALFISVNGIGIESQLDYIQKFYLASGIAAKIEEELKLSTGAVYIYSHYPARDSLFSTDYSFEYIQSLSMQADSDIVMLIDSINISDSETVKSDPFFESNSPNNDSYRWKQNRSLLTSKIGVYDGITTDIIAQLNYRDSVYWDIVGKDMLLNASSAEQYLTPDALKVIMDEVGRDIGDRFFAQWMPEYRYLFVYNNSAWRKAFRYAEAFEWDKAIDIWATELGHEDRYRAACAAINIITGCEMTDRPELALEWLEAAEQIYDPEKLGLQNYRLRLKQEIEKKREE